MLSSWSFVTIFTLSIFILNISLNGIVFSEGSAVQDLIEKADSLYDQGLYEEAIIYYDKALAIDPNDVHILYNKGISLDSVGRHDEAIMYYDKVLAIDPNYVYALNNKGAALAEQGKYQEAITYYDKVLAIEPNDVYALNNKGGALDDLGKYQEAITYFDKVLAIEPNRTNVLNNKGLVLDHLGRYQEAVTYYDKVLAIDPGDVDALNNKIAALGSLTPDFKPATFSNNSNHPLQYYVYISMSQNMTSNPSATNGAATCENIQQLVDKGLKLKPNDIKILTNGGKNLAEKCGKYQESISYYDKALAVDANYVPALYNKGVSMEKLGDHDEAQQLFDKATELDPSYKGEFIVGQPRLSNPLPSPI